MKYHQGDQMKDNMSGACGTYFVGKTWRKETTWKTKK